jgi:hypothetical protein
MTTVLHDHWLFVVACSICGIATTVSAISYWQTYSALQWVELYVQAFAPRSILRWLTSISKRAPLAGTGPVEGDIISLFAPPDNGFRPVTVEAHERYLRRKRLFGVVGILLLICLTGIIVWVWRYV